MKYLKADACRPTASCEVPEARRLKPALLSYSLAFGATAAALLHVALLARRYYTDVPFWDEWLLLPLLELDARGALGWSHLLAAHNEHRPVVARLVLIALARATSWNMWHECVLTIALGVLTLVPLWWAMRRHEASPAVRAILVGTASVVFLSANQWETWMWGWLVKVVLTTAGLTWAAFALSGARPGLPAVVTAATGGLVATLSFGNGFLVWPATAPLMVRVARQRPWLAAAWACVGAFSIWVFFRGFGQPLGVNEALASATLSRVFRVGLRVLGTALTPIDVVWLPPLIGAVGAAAAVAVALASLRGRLAPDGRAGMWWAMLLFGAASVLLIASGRQFGRQLIVPARYMAFANLFWIALTVLVARASPRLAWVGLIVAALAAANGWLVRDAYRGRHESLQKLRASLYAPIGNPEADRFFWSPGFVTPWLRDLRALSLSLYDCTTQLSRPDWDAAADAVAAHGRAGDAVITSTDWAANCLRPRLSARNSPVTVVSANESAAAVTAALAGRASAFLVSGGDVVSAEARHLVERSGYPVYRSPVGSMRLFYYPGRVAFVRDRLTPGDLAADLTAFRELGDLARAGDERFLLAGWLKVAAGDRPGRRTMVTRTATVYVPVDREAPTTLAVEVAHLAPQASGKLSVSINGTNAGAVPVGAGAGPLRLDLSMAAWRYGSNIVELEVGDPADDLSGLPEDAPIAVFSRLVFSAGRDFAR
jgi:hypothetical protein